MILELKSKGQRVIVNITTMGISIFNAFPKAIIHGVWEIGTCKHGTVIGNEFTSLNTIDVIIDEDYTSNINSTPEDINSGMLIYAKPCQMPKEINELMMTSQVVNALVANYMLYNSATGTYYMITNVGVGKNQHTGEIEHLELQITPTELADV